MTNVTILSIIHTHAQKEYRKGLEMKDTYILNILALLLFENLQRIYQNYRLNGTQSKDVKWGVGVEGASFHGFVKDGSLWNLFWCFLCIFYYRNSPILKILGQFEKLGFVIMSTRENIRFIARAPLESTHRHLIIFMGQFNSQILWWSFILNLKNVVGALSQNMLLNCSEVYGFELFSL